MHTSTHTGFKRLFGKANQLFKVLLTLSLTAAVAQAQEENPNDGSPLPKVFNCFPGRTSLRVPTGGPNHFLGDNYQI